MLLKPNLKGLSLLFPQGLWFTRVTTSDHYLIVTPAPSGGTAGQLLQTSFFSITKLLTCWLTQSHSNDVQVCPNHLQDYRALLSRGCCPPPPQLRSEIQRWYFWGRSDSKLWNVENKYHSSFRHESLILDYYSITRRTAMLLRDLLKLTKPSSAEHYF